MSKRKKKKCPKTLLSKKDAKRIYDIEDRRVVVLKGLFSAPELDELTEVLLTNHGCAPETGRRPFAKKDDEPWVRRNRRTKAWGAPYFYAGQFRESPAFHASRQGKFAWKVVCRVVKAAKQRLGIDLGLMMPGVQELGKHCVEPGQENRASLTGRKILQ